MGVKERREREREETRAKITDAARELFAREGYDAVSMRRIAEAIEYSPTAIYVHFKDKEALFQDLCRQDFGKLAEGLHQPFKGGGPGRASSSNWPRLRPLRLASIRTTTG